MKDTITMEREEMALWIREITDSAIKQTLQALGIKVKDISPWISQNKASCLIGRNRLERAMREGSVRFQKRNPDKRLGRVMVSYQDIQKLLNNPLI